MITAPQPLAQSNGIAQSAANWTAWTPAERESFFAAIGRHRRAAWRVTVATRATNLLVASIVAILMAPLFYGTLALLLDLINLMVPTPDLVPVVGHWLDIAINSPGKLSAAQRMLLVFFAALPGLLWMAVVLNAMRRVLGLCMSIDSAELGARAPDPTHLAEQRFGNVVAEMALAAGLPPPRVLVVEGPAADAVAFGLDDRHSTIIVSQALLSLLNRDQMEGVAAHLIASIADGDMQIGVRAALSLSLFALITRLGNLVTQSHARKHVTQIVMALLLPTRASARALVTELESPLDDEQDAQRAAGPPTRWEKIRPYLWLPLAGPLVITGFIGAIFNLFILGPLLSLAWRQRKYMADATAVRLTRDPDTLASALEQMTKARSAPLVTWASHLSVTDHDGGNKGGVFSGSAVPMFPSINRRLRALGTMGAHVARPPSIKLPFKFWLILGPLIALLVGCVAILFPLLIWLSLALTMLFSGLPFAVVHLLLRLLGHH